MEDKNNNIYEKPLRVTEQKTNEMLKDIGWCLDLLGNESKRRNQGITTDDIFIEFGSSLVALIHLTIQQREIRTLSNLPPVKDVN